MDGTIGTVEGEVRWTDEPRFLTAYKGRGQSRGSEMIRSGSISDEAGVTLPAWGEGQASGDSGKLHQTLGDRLKRAEERFPSALRRFLQGRDDGGRQFVRG